MKICDICGANMISGRQRIEQSRTFRQPTLSYEISGFKESEYNNILFCTNCTRVMMVGINKSPLETNKKGGKHGNKHGKK